MLIAFASMIMILEICAKKAIKNEISETEFKLFDIRGVLGYIGVAMYTYDANVIVLNIKAEAENEEKYKGIFKRAALFSIIVFLSFTSVCYYTYREESKDMFTMTLPMDAFSNLVRIGVCINAMFSYPMQILTCFNTIEKHAFFDNHYHQNVGMRKFISRSLIVLLITAISMIIPNFRDFINIVGSLTSSILSFILPELLFLNHFKGQLSIKN